MGDFSPTTALVLYPLGLLRMQFGIKNIVKGNKVHFWLLAEREHVLHSLERHRWCLAGRRDEGNYAEAVHADGA
jgi:hypothetical protein